MAARRPRRTPSSKPWSVGQKHMRRERSATGGSVVGAAGLSSPGRRYRRVAAVAICCAAGLVASACSGGGTSSSAGQSASPAPAGLQVSITPANGSSNVAPGQGITVTAAKGKLTNVTVTTGGDPVSGTLDAAGTAWHSTWALDVSQSYTVTAKAAGTQAAGTS